MPPHRTGIRPPPAQARRHDRPQDAHQRRTGQSRTVTSRAWLRDQAYAVLAAVRTEDEYFDVLGALGIKVNKRIGPDTGKVTGYSLAAPGDTNTHGEPVYFGGFKLAPDLSLNHIRETLTDPTPPPAKQHRPGPEHAWQQADTVLRQTTAFLAGDDDAAAQAQFASVSALLHNAAMVAPPASRAELRAAATAFNRANRSAIRADHQKATALRKAAKDLIYPSPDAACLAVAVIFALIHTAAAAAHWYQQRGYAQQAAAAHQALTLLNRIAAERELDTAHSPAEVLTWRLTTTPNPPHQQPKPPPPPHPRGPPTRPTPRPRRRTAHDPSPSTRPLTSAVLRSARGRAFRRARWSQPPRGRRTR
jgi:hypothetical protein